MPESALSVSNLVKEYDNGLVALDKINIEVAQGTFFGLLGPNGAGKTTLISILGGLSKPTSGTATVMGYDVVKESMQVRRSIGIVPQEIIFDPFFSVRQYLKQQSSYYGLFKNDDWVDELLEKLGLKDQADTNTRKLSGGMKRRLMAALALVHKPQVVVLDEPTAGVDVSQRRNLWNFVNKLNIEGITVILTTHYLEEAEELCERIVMVDHGKVLADERTKDLLANSKLNSHCLHIRLNGDGQIPEDIPFECSKQADSDGFYQIQFCEYEQIEQILAYLRGQGLSINEMQLASVDLEEIFVNLTGVTS